MVRIEKVKMADGSEKLELSSPYHPDLPARAKALGGKFSGEKKAWYFDPRDEERVHALAIEVYGTDGTSATNLVTLLVSFPKGYEGLADDVAAWPVVHRSSRLPQSPCPSCGGTGRWGDDIPCGWCNGEGVLR